MIKSKRIRNITIALLAAVAALSVFCAAKSYVGINAAEETVTWSNTTDRPLWKLIGEKYRVENYSDRIRVFDPNGESIKPSDSGEFVFTVIGEYTIVAPDETIKILSLAKKPSSEISFGGEIKESYKTGEVFTLPEVSIKNDLYAFDSYQTEVIKDGVVIETAQVQSGRNFLYLFKFGGEYEFNVFAVNDRGDKDEKSVKTTVTDERSIFAEDLPEEITVGEKISIGYPYGYYNGKPYDVSVTISFGGKSEKLKKTYFVPTEAGEYTTTYKSVIDGVSIEKQTKTTVLPEKQEFSFNGNGVFCGLTELPSYLYKRRTVADNKALLIRSDSAKEKVTYNRIINLSSLTKEDNLFSILPYSDENSFMETLTVTFTDVYDAERSISVRLWSSVSQAGENMPNSFCAVKVGNSYTAYNNQSNDGSLRSPHGAIAFLTSFKGQRNDCSDLWSVQYDAEGEILYLTTERNTGVYSMAQYPLVSLSDKGTLPDSLTVPANAPLSGIKYSRPDAKNYFKGFTTDEVYVTFEFEGNIGAGIYLNELAGLKAENLLSDEYEGKDVILPDKPITDELNAVKGYFFDVPSASFASFFMTTEKVDIKVTDPDGKETVLKNGGFVPEKAGAYTVIYSGNLKGSRYERKVTLTVLDKPVDILIEMQAPAVKFGEYFVIPDYTVTGGIGKITSSARVLQNGKEIVPTSEGYQIKDGGETIIEITAKDSVGYTAVKKFGVTIENGKLFVCETEPEKAIKAGGLLKVPDGKFIVCENGTTKTVISEIFIIADGKKLEKAQDGYVVPEKTETLYVEYGYLEYRERYYINVLPEKINSVTDYFVCDNTATKIITEAGVNIRYDRDISFNMPYSISADGAIFTFGFNKDEKVCSSAEFILRSGNKTLTLKFSDFAFADDSSSVTIGGMKAGKIYGRTYTYSDFCGEEETIKVYDGREYILYSVSIDVASDVIKNVYTDKVFASIDVYDDGDTFYGFKNNAFDLTVKTHNSAEKFSDFIIGQIGNHYFNYLNDVIGYDESDGIGPAITVFGEKTNRTVNFGDKTDIAAAIGLDVLSGKCDVTVYVKQNGVTKLSQGAEKSFTLSIDGYKPYTVIYESTDKNGNTSTLFYIITVKDNVCPIVTVKGDYAKEYKLGDSVTILDCDVTDEQNGVVYEIFVMSDDLTRTYLSAGDSFTFIKKGTYEIVYRAADDYYNVTRKVYTVEVR